VKKSQNGIFCWYWHQMSCQFFWWTCKWIAACILDIIERIEFLFLALCWFGFFTGIMEHNICCYMKHVINFNTKKEAHSMKQMVPNFASHIVHIRQCKDVLQKGFVGSFYKKPFSMSCPQCPSLNRERLPSSKRAIHTFCKQWSPARY